jgi:hypothetical protein
MVAADRPQVADAATEPSLLEKVWSEVQIELARAAADRGRKPPQPVSVRWAKRRLGLLELDAPLLALAIRDVDRDGKAELAALTTRKVAIVRVRGRNKLALGPEIALPTQPAPIRARDPVGALSIDAVGVVLARTSDQAEGMAIEWKDGQLVERQRLTGFPLCDVVTAELVPGRSLFAAGSLASSDAAGHRGGAAEFVSARCARDLVDPEGYALDLFGVVSVDDTLTVRCRRNGAPCEAGTGDRDYDAAGHAFDLSDIDNDGRPEVITTSTAPRGLSDRVSVHSSGPDGVRVAFETKLGGSVSALASGDIDGDGAREVIAAVRLSRTTRVELWTLN